MDFHESSIVNVTFVLESESGLDLPKTWNYLQYSRRASHHSEEGRKRNQLCICSNCLKQLIIEHSGIFEKHKFNKVLGRTVLYCKKRECIYNIFCTINETSLLVALPSSNFKAQNNFPWDPSFLFISIFFMFLFPMMLLLWTNSNSELNNRTFSSNPNETNYVSNEETSNKLLDHRKSDFVPDLSGTRKPYSQLKVPCHKCKSYQLMQLPHTWSHLQSGRNISISPFFRNRQHLQLFTSYFWNCFFTILLICPLFLTTECSQSPSSPSSRKKIQLFCDHFSVESSLNDEELLQCTRQNLSQTCCEPVARILELDNSCRSTFNNFSQTLKQYATAKSYSVQWSIDQCKNAYKHWICSMRLDYFSNCTTDGRSLTPPCPSLCTNVEASCPFFRVYNHTKLYGGQSTFLCHDVDDSAPERCYSLNNRTKPKYPSRQLVDYLEGVTTCRSSVNRGWTVTKKSISPQCHSSVEVPDVKYEIEIEYSKSNCRSIHGPLSSIQALLGGFLISLSILL